MKKILTIIALLSMTLIMLTACGKKTFECVFCGETITEKPHMITVSDEEIELCDSCFGALEDLKSELEETDASSKTESKTLKPVDVFQDIALEYDGRNGEAFVKIINNSTDAFVSACEFKAEPYNNLSNGDTIIVTVSYKESMSELYGCVPEKETIEITVAGLPFYVNQVSQVPADIIKEFANKYLMETEEQLVDDFIFSYQNVQYIATYLLVTKDSSYPIHNELRMYLSYDEYRNGVFYQTVYKARSYRNVSVFADGTLNLKYDQFPYTSFTDDIVEELKSFENEYVCMKVD